MHDILEKKLGKRPNRKSLVEKNILLDSKAAPSLQLKCKEFKRARLADDLNVRISNRPGPLELVESGILISSDSSLTQAIKDGRIIYPRTSSAASRVHHPNQALILHQFDTNNFDDLASLNFNFNQTDTEDSNASQQSNSTTKTTNTINSANSFNFTGALSSNALNKQQFVEFFAQSSASSSPASTAIGKSSPASSPHPLDSTLLNNQVPSPNLICNEIFNSKSKTNKKSFKSSSSTTSSTVSFKSTKSSSNGSNKKALIFHEYKGPNHKNSKSSFRFSSNKSIQKFSRNNSITNSNANGMNLSDANHTDMMNCLIEDSSDSAQSPLFDSATNSELNAYKIRLEQQEMFLLYNNQNSPKTAQNPIIENHQTNSNSITTFLTNNSNSTSSTNTGNYLSDEQIVVNDNKNIQLATNSISVPAQTPHMSNCVNTSLSSNNAQTPIILPINDIKSLDSLRTLGFINTISISETSTGSVENQQPALSFTNQSANIYSIETENGSLTQIGQLLSTANSLPNNSAVGTFNTTIPNLPTDQMQSVEMSETSNNKTNSSSFTTLKSAIDESTTQKRNHFELMTLNELREECVRNGLAKKGNKPILIERLRFNIEKHQQQQQQQLTLAPSNNQNLVNQQRSFIKSPDSGVNMDEPSPCSSINSINNNNNLASLNKANTANIQQTSGTTPVNLISVTNNQSIYYDFDANNLINCSPSPSLSVSSSLSATKLPNKQTPSDHHGTEYKQIEDIRNQLKLDTFRTSSQLQTHQQSKFVNNLNNGSEFVVNEPNLEETAAYLEMSWKNTAKLIKELSSSSAKIEQIQQVEQQVQESMQYIERLKLACKTKPPINSNSINSNSDNDISSANYLSTNINSSSNLLANDNASASLVNGANLRLINSEPSNLKHIVSYSNTVDSNNENYQAFQTIINNNNSNSESIKNLQSNHIDNHDYIPSFGLSKNVRINFIYC